MDFTAGMGTSAVFVLAAIVWLAYLVPVWAKRRELSTAEIEAARLQRTLQALSETTEAGKAVELDLRAKEIARTRKLMEKEVRLREARARAEAVQRAREIDEQIKRIEREVKVVVRSSTTRMARLRRTKLACTFTALVALVGLATGILVTSLWPVAIAAAALLLIAAAGLVMVNRSSRQVARVATEAKRETDAVLRETGVIAAREKLESASTTGVDARAAAAEETEEHMRSRSWSPQQVPEQRSSAQSREEYAVSMAERIQEAIRREVAEQGREYHRVESFSEVMGIEEEPEGARVSVAGNASRRNGASHSAPVQRDAEASSAQKVAPSLSEVEDTATEEDVAFDVRAAFARRLG